MFCKSSRERRSQPLFGPFPHRVTKRLKRRKIGAVTIECGELAMTLTIDLPDEQTAALAAKARAQGVSAEEYARQLLAHALEVAGPRRRHISEVIRDNMRKVPPEILAAMPNDGASEHDHYIYGLPKRNP
jgi:plasmid stability protein